VLGGVDDDGWVEDVDELAEALSVTLVVFVRDGRVCHVVVAVDGIGGRAAANGQDGVEVAEFIGGKAWRPSIVTSVGHIVKMSHFARAVGSRTHLFTLVRPSHGGQMAMGLHLQEGETRT